MSLIIKMDSNDLTLLQFVDKDTLYNQPRLSITQPGHVEGGVYYPAESIMIYGAKSIVKLYEFLGECVKESKLIKQSEFPFAIELTRKAQVENDTDTLAGKVNPITDMDDDIDV